MGGARLYLSVCETVFETKEKKGRDTFMDKIDAMLITLLQENARAPLKLLASKVFLSAPAVSSRIDKLEKQGILVVMTREGENDLSDPGAVNAKVQDLQRRVQLIHEKKPDCVISIHQNSYPDAAVKE